MVKSLPAKRETWVQSLSQEVPLEKEMATHLSILAWRIPWMEEPCRLLWSQRVGHDWATSLTYLCQQWNLFTFSSFVCSLELTLLNFFQEFFLCIHSCLTIWYKRPSFQSVSAFDMPSSLRLITSSFWFKVRGRWLFLSLEHVEATVRSLMDLISILLGPKE